MINATLLALAGAYLGAGFIEANAWMQPDTQHERDKLATFTPLQWTLLYIVYVIISPAVALIDYAEKVRTCWAIDRKCARLQRKLEKQKVPKDLIDKLKEVRRINRKSLIP